MASSTHWLASQSAMAELEAGGNAFDAAIAGAFVLHVVEPHLNGPAGEVPAMFATAEDPTPRVLCGQGTAPAGATREHYLGLGLDLVPGSGPLAAAIPGAVDAWLMLGRDHGTRPLRDVLSYAIGYARGGSPAAADRGRDGRPGRAAVPRALADLGGPVAAPRRGCREPWDTVTNPEHAATLERLVAEGEAAGNGREAQYDGARRAWREGFVAEAVDAFSRRPFRDSSGADHAGVLTGADLAGWTASYEPAVVQRFRDVEVAKTDLWGQGPVLLQALAMLDGLPDEALDPSTADGVHTVTEVLKLALADREAWFGDASPVTAASCSTRRTSRRGARWSATAPRPSCGRGRPAAASRCCPRTCAAASERPRGRPGWASRRSPGTGRPAATPATSTWSTGGATSSRRRRAAAGCRAPPPSPSSASASAAGCRCAGSTRGCRRRWRRAGARAPRSPPRWCCATGSRCWPAARPAATSRTSGSCRSCCVTWSAASDLQEAIDAPAFHTTSVPSSFYPREMNPACWSSRTASAPTC